MIENREQFFNAIRSAQSLAERNAIAAEWLRDISSDCPVVLDKFPDACAGFFSAVLYSADNAETAELLALAIRGAYIIGRVSER